MGQEIMLALEHHQVMKDPPEMLRSHLCTHQAPILFQNCSHCSVLCHLFTKNVVLSKGSLLKISLCYKCFDSDYINLHDSCHNTWKLAMLMMDIQHFLEISLQWELRGKAGLARPQNLRRS